MSVPQAVARPVAEALAGRDLLLTGATGFVGRCVRLALADLAAAGCRPRRVHLVARTVPRDWPGLEPWEGVLAPRALDAADWDGEADWVLHAAGSSAPDQGLEVLASGLRATAHLLRRPARGLLMLSSGAVYGPVAGGPLDEARGFAPHDPFTHPDPYTEAKRLAEALGAEAARKGAPVVVARMFAALGAAVDPSVHWAPVALLRAAREGRPLVLGGGADAVRSYLGARDLGWWLLALMVRGTPGTAYNVGSDEGLSLRELAARIRDRYAPGLAVEVKPGAPPLRPWYVPDVTRARTLGLEAWQGLDSVLDETWDALSRG